MGKRRANSTISRTGPPDRTLTKLQGVRHVLHCAVRMQLNEEDPFATHLMLQSCEKVIGDILRLRDPTSVFNIETWIRPEHAGAFWNVFREASNFLKHADKDSEVELGVRNIVEANELLTIICFYSCSSLEVPLSTHATFFLTYICAFHPDASEWMNFPEEFDIEAWGSSWNGSSRKELKALVREVAGRSGPFAHELNQDLSDIRMAGEELRPMCT